jgi:hypothetical protein
VTSFAKNIDLGLEKRGEVERHQIHKLKRVNWEFEASSHLLASTSCIFHLHNGVLAHHRSCVFSPRGVPHVNSCVTSYLGILLVICADCLSSCLLLEPSLKFQGV